MCDLVIMDSIIAVTEGKYFFLYLIKSRKQVLCYPSILGNREKSGCLILARKSHYILTFAYIASLVTKMVDRKPITCNFTLVLLLYAFDFSLYYSLCLFWILLFYVSYQQTLVSFCFPRFPSRFPWFNVLVFTYFSSYR